MSIGESCKEKMSINESFLQLHSASVSVIDMEHELWQLRARNAGLRQNVLARLAGVTPTTASLQLRGKGQGAPPAYMRTIIRAWEMLTPAQRQALIEATDSGDDAV
jgi:hypothetical protein